MTIELKKAYEELYRAARDILELSEPNDNGFDIHEDCYKDLAEAHKAVYQAKENAKDGRHAA